jgi:hypothetical protein
MRASYFLWGVLAVAVGSSLFLLKYKVQDLEDQLHASQAQIARDRSAIKVLQAEWTYLNDPERLRRLSAEHLGFGPARKDNIIDVNALPFRGDTAPQAAMQPTIPARQIPPGEIEAKVIAPAGFAPVLIARIQRLLFSSTAGAATPPSRARERRP